MPGGLKDRRAIIRFHNADLIPNNFLARHITVELGIMPRAKSFSERVIVRTLEEHYALDFRNLAGITHIPENELNYSLERMRIKEMVEW